MPTVIGIDPGQTTGYAVLSVPEDALLGARGPNDKLHRHVTINEIGQIDCAPPWENRSASELAEIKLMHYPLDSVFVIEDFIIDFRRIDQQRSTLSPVRVTAKIEMALWVDASMARKNVEDILFFQSASLAKTTCTDDRLKEWGLYDRTSGVHARDAMRHAYYFLRTCRGNTFKAKEIRWKAFPRIYNDPVFLGHGTEHDVKPIEIRKRTIGTRIEGL
jgi:hypothetical protein